LLFILLPWREISNIDFLFLMSRICDVRLNHSIQNLNLSHTVSEFGKNNVFGGLVLWGYRSLGLWQKECSI
jgi:hypothetical protein